MPPEWARHDATWLTWPHNEQTWPGCLDEARDAYCEMIRAIGQGERVELIVQDADAEHNAKAFLKRHYVDLTPVRFHHTVTNDSWVRDYGLTFTIRNAPSGVQCLHAVNWRFDAWGEKYPPWDADNAAGNAIAEHAGCRSTDIAHVFEGGSIDIDERGCVLTTKANMTARGRDETFFDVLRQHLGVTDVIVLGEGIAGDDTDGHVDDITRFVPGGAILTAVEEDAGDANYTPLQENLDILQRLASHHVETLPMPEPVFNADGQRLPASYANFTIANAAVLVPTFGQPTDSVALSTIQRHFDDRPVVGIDARTLVVGLGACHCLTLQQPAV